MVAGVSANAACTDPGDHCVAGSTAGTYACECNPTCTNNSGMVDCGQANSCNTGYCNVADCADADQACTAGGGGMFSCVCPPTHATCGTDCCHNTTDSCETKTQTATGNAGPTNIAPSLCCTAAQDCTEPGRDDVCCTGAGLSCVDSNNNGKDRLVLHDGAPDQRQTSRR